MNIQQNGGSDVKETWFMNWQLRCLLFAAYVVLPLSVFAAPQPQESGTAVEAPVTEVPSLVAVPEPPEATTPKTAADATTPEAGVESVKRIQLVDGCVSSNAVFFSVADEVHWIAGEVATVMKSIGAGVNTDADAMLSREQVNSLVGRFPAVFTLSTDEDGSEFLDVNKSQLAAGLTNRKSGLRSWIASVANTPLSKLTLAKETWTTEQPPRVVITLAGLHGFSSSADKVAEELNSQTGLPVASFAYPNDEPILQAANRLATALEAFHLGHPKTQVTLVTHSMGGLVARAVLERSDRANQFGEMPAINCVDQLVMVCPPNHGSALSEYGPLLEGVEQLSRLFSGEGGERRAQLLLMIRDGFNEAPKDLNPTSEFLERLNSEKRPECVKYAILAGDAGPLRRGAAMLFGRVWDVIATKVDEPENLDRRIREVLQADELISGKGDGVVALRSAQLQGVDDFEVVPMSHLTWSQLETPAAQKMIAEIVSRLGISL